MSKYHDDLTVASDPGRFELSDTKLKKLCPELYGLMPRIVGLIYARDWNDLIRLRDVIREHIALGDTRAAVVIRKRPLLVAAYTDELDCVAVLRFENKLASTFGLEEKTRLLTVNTYGHISDSLASDLTPGSNSTNRYGNFQPIIADFLVDDTQQVHRRKRDIGEPEWQRAWNLAQEWIAKHGSKARDGNPVHCANPAF